MLSVDMFLHICMCENVPCPSHSQRHMPTHRMGLQTKHTHTHVSVHRSAHLCCNPSPCFAVYCFSPFAVRLLYCWGLEFCLLSGWEERGEETHGEEEWREGGDGGSGRSSAGQRHCVDDLLQLAPQSLSPCLLVPLQSWQDLKKGTRGQRMQQEQSHVTVTTLLLWVSHFNRYTHLLVY